MISTLQFGDIVIQGKSEAAYQTVFWIKPFDILLDLGLCPAEFSHVPDVFISHFHLDHWAGLPQYAALRKLFGHTPPRIRVPVGFGGPLQVALDAVAAVERDRYPVEITEVSPAEPVHLRGNWWIKALPMSHPLGCQGYVLYEIRKKLKPEYHGLPPVELIRLKAEGIEISAPLELPLLAYTSDSTITGILANPLLGQVPILLCECTYLDREDGDDRNHVILDEIVANADFFKNEHLVLFHFSMRYRRSEVEGALRRVLPSGLYERVSAFGG